MKLHDLLGTNHVLRAGVAAVATGAAFETVIGRAPHKCVVSAAAFVPTATITGAATNNRTLTIFNRGSDGTGTKALATITFGNGTDGAANVAKVLTLGADLAVAAGDIITCSAGINGTGLALPAGTVQVDTQGA